MPRRIEQSRRHGQADPRWSGRVQRPVIEAAPAVDDTEPLESPPPTLRLVGGTDTTEDSGDTRAGTLA